jgi:hypothetical protein
MDQNKTCLEMAFELARSGEFSNLDLLERRLRDQGYSTAQLDGPSLRRQMRTLMVAADKMQGSTTPASWMGATNARSHGERKRKQTMPKPKLEDESPEIDLEQDRGTRPTEPVETDSNDIPTADANGDSDDERADENQAVQDRS